MSRRKKEIERVKKEKARQERKRVKAKRQCNDPVKWRKKKEKRQSKQKEIWESKFPYANKDCKLILSKFPSPENCGDCKLECPYNNH